MREIKFRAWDLIEEKYYWWFQWMEYLISPHMAGGNHMSFSGSRREDRILLTHGKANTARFVIEQYTGLEDKNGKEIYEGDIVSWYNPYSKKTYIGYVKWDDEWAGFGLFLGSSKYCEESDWYKIIESVEIIGNIHENPELLEDDDAGRT
ncbi:hypothetical protein GWN42_31275 [candidate division KSB1 bacterium]|nr:hypothetical protein [Deltaproteobacteria bacterium]NIV97151.1 hypothetical protein [candidate division KSB1 bacterium]